MHRRFGNKKPLHFQKINHIAAFFWLYLCEFRGFESEVIFGEKWMCSSVPLLKLKGRGLSNYFPSSFAMCSAW